MLADDPRRLGLASLRPAGIVLAIYQLAFGAALYVVLRGDLLDAALCFGPVALVAALALTSQADRKQYIARLLAAALFLPIGLLFWASSHPAGGWMLVALAAAHVAAFVLVIAWLARLATRIDPDRLVATNVRFDGDEVRFDYPPGTAVDDDAVITLFAALVTRSGYAWAPRLFD